LTPQSIDPRLPAFLAEKGLDVSHHRPKSIEQVPNLAHYHVVIAFDQSVYYSLRFHRTLIVCIDWSVADLCDGHRPARHRAGRQRLGDRAARLPAVAQAMVTAMADSSVVEVRDLRISYDGREVVHGISFDVKRGEIFGIIGPAQSGKTSLLKSLNRTLEFTPGARITGEVIVEGHDVMRVRDVFALRRHIGIVAPLPVGLPLSIYDNVAFAPRTAGIRSRANLNTIVERCLMLAELWDEVKDRLDSLGTKLSGGQQQRLTIARALSHDPTILCLDEFSIAIDPVTTMKIEEMLKQLRQQMTIILVTNLTQQARRLADRAMFLLNGQIVEIDRSAVVFSEHPGSRRTHEYVNGIFG
jgi:phosphate transport system ATP-binding protein